MNCTSRSKNQPKFASFQGNADHSWAVQIEVMKIYGLGCLHFFSHLFSDCILHPPRVLPYAAPQMLMSSLPAQNHAKLGFKLKLTSGFSESLVRVPIMPLTNHSSCLRVQCVGTGQNDDGFYMRRCVELARKAVGHTSPNPVVGCVIVKDGKVVGEGFHPKAGQPHAEVFALRNAGDLAENATAYVSLEPCNHFGRTPPCTEALIKAKVKKVVVGMVDQNPTVASRGVKRLRDASIEVVVGVEEELCKRLTEAFTHRMLTGKPFLTVRYSLSVNGNLLDQLGEGVIESGGYYSRLLQEYDALVVSSSLLSENISLPSSREPGANQPLHIIIQRSSTSSIPIPMINDEVTGKVIVFTDSMTGAAPEVAQKGIETVALDQINLDVILDYCYRQGLCSVLLDLRGPFVDFEELIKEGMEKKYFNKFVTEILPAWNGCAKEDSAMTLKSLGQGLEVTNLLSKSSHGSVVIEGYFKF
ncbi:hypothetical protein L6164_003871 [Bauhinia variegata]|uniref:Uncharacterized protein n=1 Tax=Bauhinia variegata TaxID=167791 RepID=A0ACB9Q2M1_BAUVA|nr:hypothetical protein L6164_003871 [Bauhinia variegata]